MGWIVVWHEHRRCFGVSQAYCFFCWVCDTLITHLTLSCGTGGWSFQLQLFTSDVERKGKQIKKSGFDTIDCFHNVTIGFPIGRAHCVRWRRLHAQPWTVAELDVEEVPGAYKIHGLSLSLSEWFLGCLLSRWCLFMRAGCRWLSSSPCIHFERLLIPCCATHRFHFLIQLGYDLKCKQKVQYTRLFVCVYWTINILMWHGVCVWC